MSESRTEPYNIQYSKSIEELAQNISGAPMNNSSERLMRLVYEQKTIERQDENNKNQIELQHKLNKQNIDYQHSLNLQIITKQIRATKTTAYLTAASTLVAALAGTYLAYALTQTQKPIQIKLDSEQFVQLRKATNVSEVDLKRTIYKSPSLPPSK